MGPGDKMQYTPESSVYPESHKGQRCYDCCDSGYSGLFHSPQSVSVGDFCGSLSPVEFAETPKENVRLPVTPRERIRESRGPQPVSAVSWCETPKVHKRDASLRHRLQMCKPNTEGKGVRSPCTRRTESSVGGRSSHWLSASFESLDTLASSSGIELQEQQLSVGKRRLLFSQIRTSTLEDGKLPAEFERRVSLSGADFSKSFSALDHINIETPRSRKPLPASSKDNSPVCVGASDLNDVFCTPSSSRRPKYTRTVCDDSGFSSLTLDKSQDSSVDHDGSFQELLLSASRKNCDNLTDAKRRSRLQRQHRLSTLREGGSQSEEDPADRQQGHRHHRSYSKDVFADDATPRRAPSLKCGNGSASDATPLRASLVMPETLTPLSTTPANPDVTTPVNLSLTPALQLVHAMCQQKAQMFAGQSPSLKEQLKSTAALVETPGTFRTAMPLAGLIGRKMGLGKMDVLTELKKRNLRHILAVVLGHLTPESLYRCGQVCKSWKEIILQDKRAAFRRRSHLSDVRASLELGAPVHVPDAETRLMLLKRSALKTVQARSRSSSFCTPQSGSSTSLNSEPGVGSSSKRDKFLEVAKTLFNDECLKPCPRCEHPARCHSVKGEAVCSRADCGFQFCTSCLCSFHGSRECGSRSAGRRKSDILLPGSAQSRRNVRRL